ncbi:hypothetical protein [uncultured Hyphomicrobium sp.]|uniref:hypothetical protein n=1 Tax=uncultured Hyphomicrobium sp. TaxID=194373 RepID=UPI0025EC1B6D|nr:hypothetical protein [uncultured Hyphomicrobium sp.]
MAIDTEAKSSLSLPCDGAFLQSHFRDCQKAFAPSRCMFKGFPHFRLGREA